MRRIGLCLLVAALIGGCQAARPQGDGRVGLGDDERVERRPAAAGGPRTLRQSGPAATGAEAGEQAETGEQAEAEPLPEAELYPGSGRFVREDIPRARVSRDRGGYTLNFADADVRKVVDTVLGEALGENYAVDPRIEGTITARTARPLARDQVIPALEDILAMNGAALVRAEGIYRVVPLESAGTVAPILAGDGRRGDTAFALHVIPLNFVAAEAMQATLQPFLAPGRTLHVDAARNLLLFRGPGSEARDLVAMVDTFDVDWMAGMSFALLPLDNATAGDVVEELRTIFGQQEESPRAGIVRFLPIERMNAVLVISEQPAYLRKAQTWTERLDRGGAEDERQLYVYHVENSRAADLAEVLGEVFQVTTTGGRRDRPEVAPGQQAGGFSTSFSRDGGFGTGGLGTRGTGAGTGTRRNSDGNPNGNPNGNAENGDRNAGNGVGRRDTRERTGRAAGGGRISETFGAAPGDGNGENGDGPRIIADTRNNALLILATAKEYRMIESTLRRLDLVPLQVLIEATIAEVTLNDALRYGLRWFFQADEGDTDQTITFSDLSSGAVSSTFPGFSYLLDSGDVQVALNALDEISDVNVISSPQLMVLDNETARLQVGDQVPVPTQQARSVTDPEAPIVNSIQFQDTGVILEVTPHVNASGLVVLDVRQEVSDVVETTTSDIDAPTIQQRQIDSSVAVQTGETIALGGLIRDSREDARAGVPVLMHIPVLGNLFGSTSITNQRTELLILLTPRVVRDQEEAREVTRELRRRLRGVKNLEERIGDFRGSEVDGPGSDEGAPARTPEAETESPAADEN